MCCTVTVVCTVFHALPLPIHQKVYSRLTHTWWHTPSCWPYIKQWYHRFTATLLYPHGFYTHLFPPLCLSCICPLIQMLLPLPLYPPQPLPPPPQSPPPSPILKAIQVQYHPHTASLTVYVCVCACLCVCSPLYLSQPWITPYISTILPQLRPYWYACYFTSGLRSPSSCHRSSKKKLTGNSKCFLSFNQQNWMAKATHLLAQNSSQIHKLVWNLSVNLWFPRGISGLVHKYILGKDLVFPTEQLLHHTGNAFSTNSSMAMQCDITWTGMMGKAKAKTLLGRL